MNQNTFASLAAPESSRIAARIAIVLATAFLIILALLHFLEPEFDPSWRMISEYELGRFGWLMSFAFYCWGGSVLALLSALWSSLRTPGGRVGRWWLVVIVAALFGAGIFVTNAITDNTLNPVNTLHTLCGAIVILTFPIAVSLVARGLARNQEWADARRHLLWVTLLVWSGPVAFIGSIIISNIVNPSAGRVGPQVLLGWPNRYLVVTYIIWILIVALHVARGTKPPAGEAVV